MYLISAGSDLRLFKECERCFWFAYKGHAPHPVLPPSPFEDAARKMLYGYFDKYRGKLPPDFIGALEGALVPDTELVDHWRNWRKGLRHSNAVMSAVLYGAMDDCLVQDKEYHVPIEFRLVSREPFEDEVKDAGVYLDGLSYLLTANGYKTLEFGYVIYYYPQSVTQHHALMLQSKVLRRDTDLLRAERSFF